MILDCVKWNGLNLPICQWPDLIFVYIMCIHYDVFTNSVEGGKSTNSRHNLPVSLQCLHITH